MLKSSLDNEGRLSRPLIVVGAGVIAVAVAIALNVTLTDRQETPPRQEPRLVSPAVPPATPLSAPAPTFDVVRVEPGGGAVIAGRAPAGSRIVVRSGESIVGESVADDRGQWLIVPETPLAPGTHELVVETHGADGTIRKGDDVVVLVVPAGRADEGALAVRTAGVAGGPSTVLQAPTAPAAPSLSIQTVDARSDGKLSIGGRAPPNSRIRVYIDDRFAGEAVADSVGLWRLLLTQPLGEGVHALRADQVGDGGRVIARARVPLRLADGIAAVGPPPAAGTALVVERGDNLWRIARTIYGQGTAYTFIYDANRHQIEDPDLIYPGQVFHLPKVQ